MLNRWRQFERVELDLVPRLCVLTGPNGCGKTTVSRCVLRALVPTSGAIRFTVDGKAVDLAVLSKRELKRYRRHMQMVFQDPFSSLNPRMGIADIIVDLTSSGTTC